MSNKKLKVLDIFSEDTQNNRKGVIKNFELESDIELVRSDDCLTGDSARLTHSIKGDRTVTTSHVFSISKKIVDSVIESELYKSLEDFLKVEKVYKEIRVMDKAIVLIDTSNFDAIDFKRALNKQEVYMLDYVDKVQELTEAMIQHIHLKKEYRKYINRQIDGSKI